jgi:hypothetical protein
MTRAEALCMCQHLCVGKNGQGKVHVEGRREPCGVLQTINTMAVLTMLLTQDRCTKNYLLYLDLDTKKWQMLAYDIKSALNADAGYGGMNSKSS